MALERIQLDLVAPGQDILVAFFRDVSASASELLQKELLARNPAFEYAFIDATSIISRAHLLSAVFSALNAAATGSLRTPNVHSEIVISLGPNNNIANAYRRWGIQAGKTSNLIVVKVLPSTKLESELPSSISSTSEQVWAHLTQHLQGATPTPLTDEELAKTTDWAAKIRKYYKLNGVPALDAIKDEAAKKKEMERHVIMGMALREL
ncbi:Kinase binding protein CGI-121 domain containing protein [Naviculisporaceae sp. PSN 640]